MKTIFRLFATCGIFMLTLSCFVGCQKMENTDRSKKQLLGTWMTEPTETEWGTVIHAYTFEDDLSVLYMMRPNDPDDLEEDVIPIKARYKMNDKNTFTVFIGKSGDELRGEINEKEMLIWNKTDKKPLIFKKEVFVPRQN